MVKQTHNEIRRSPQEDSSGFRSPHVNRTLVPEAANNFLRPNEKKLLDNKHSFVVNTGNRTPPKYGTEKQIEPQNGGNPSRTPTKYKSIFENSTKTSATSRRSPEAEEKKVFKSLNEIIANKNKEKTVVEVVRPPLKTSRMINGFEFGNVLGKGKFGEVFLARHHETGFIAAIKKIERGKVVEFKMMEQFAKEIRLHSCLDHPNIVKFFGVFQEKEEIYLVMEYMNGGTLFDYLNEVTALTLREAAEYLRDIIEALTYMHDKSIAHRDIKPENIVVSSEGVAKLCDFGWSAVV
jgi:predicted Ser/Thr protein kinase